MFVYFPLYIYGALKSAHSFHADVFSVLVINEGNGFPHEKINRCLTDINRCLTDIFKI